MQFMAEIFNLFNYFQLLSPNYFALKGFPKVISAIPCIPEPGLRCSFEKFISSTDNMK